jgi:glycosyltransferase involved in cell wall biosynthesis
VTTVVHYVERWLELSAGFVAGHVGRSRHRAVVVSRDGWLNLESFPHRPRHSLAPVRDRVPERLKPVVLDGQLRAVLGLHRADVVHVHFGYAAGDVLSVTRRRPFVLSLHGHDVTGLLHDQPDRYRVVASRADAVVVPSRFLLRSAVDAGFPESRIRVIPSGVDTGFFTPTAAASGPPVVAFVGRLVAKKGIDVLLDAWPRVREQQPDARLVVLGDGPLASLLPADDPSVTRLVPEPARRHDQVREVMRRARVVVTPSRTAPDGDSESLLLVNLEAAASARPVVSTRHGGILEYVDDDRTGLLVPEADPGALAGAVARVLGDEALARRLGAAGPAHAARFEVRRCSAAVDDLYDELLAGAAAVRRDHANPR